MLQPGISAEVKFVVTDELTAKTVGSGTLDVLATPVMIARLEQAAWTSVAPHLAEGEGTVGLITYMRTDSLRISEEAMAAAK